MKISTGIPIFNTPVDPQGTENQPPNAIFHAGSKNLMSHIIDVSETAIIVKAYGFLNDASTITVCTVTTERDGKNYAAPMVLNGRHVQLSNRNNVLVIDMTGKYTFQLSDGLGVTTCAYHESGLGLWSFGLSAFAIANGMLEFVDTETTHVEMVENQVRVYLKKSNLDSNLLQVRHSPTIPDDPGIDPNTDEYGPEGLYYGIDAGKYAYQYVSSMVGNDANLAVIFLRAGDIFSTVTTAYTGTPATPIDVIGGMTTQAALNLTTPLNISDKQITFAPYNDPAIDAITAYNNANGTNVVPYLCREINFPTIKITLVLPTDGGGVYVPVGYSIGVNGHISFRGVNIDVGQTGTVNPGYLLGAFGGYGKLIFEGGNTKLGSIPLLYTSLDVFTFTASFHMMSDHTVATVGPPGPLFCRPATQYFINTVDPSVGGGVMIPALPAYHYNGDNCQTYLEPLAMWPGITIYSAPNRCYKKVITSVNIH
jgi:hypothetical protein